MKPLLLTLLLLSNAEATAAAAPCHLRETAVVVQAREHTLHLCQAGKSVARYAVALGSGGLGKRLMGDGKTPLGAYPLALPRASSSYGTFVHVGYPTPIQQKLGFTGNAIGIHGPPRGWLASTGALTSVDWTAGCIAVGTDAEIDAIAGWIRRLQVRSVRIE